MERIQDYINLLKDSLEKKLEVLEQIYTITKNQSDILVQKELNMDEFDETMNQKEDLIKNITLLDEGFNGIYDRVRIEIKEQTHLYQETVKHMKELITKISNITVEIQIIEHANKGLVEGHYSKINTKVRTLNKGSRQSLAYYKNAHSGIMEQSFLMDEKK